MSDPFKPGEPATDKSILHRETLLWRDPRVQRPVVGRVVLLELKDTGLIIEGTLTRLAVWQHEHSPRVFGTESIHAWTDRPTGCQAHES